MAKMYCTSLTNPSNINYIHICNQYNRIQKQNAMLDALIALNMQSKFQVFISHRLGQERFKKKIKKDDGQS